MSSSVLLGGDKFDSVFDRGSFGAVDKEDRERYAKYAMLLKLVLPVAKPSGLRKVEVVVGKAGFSCVP